MIPSGVPSGLAVVPSAGGRERPAWASAQYPHARTPPWTLTAEPAAAVATLWEHLQRVPTDRRLALALRRFEGSFDRAEAEDRFVDYWIALEALYLPDGPHNAMRKARIRIPNFLAASDERADAMADLVSRSYQLRSAVVHGEDTPLETVEDVTSETGELVRGTLRRCLVGAAAPSLEVLRAPRHSERG
jgi:hypothetical protein